MAVPILPKQSNTATTVPTTGNLVDGEFAINTVDKIIYVRVGSNIVPVANFSSGGTSERNITFGLRATTSGDRLDTEIVLPFSGTITKWKLNCANNINCVLVLKKNGTNICGSTFPTITNDTFAQSSTLTGWTTSVGENDKLLVSVTSKDISDLLKLVLTIST